MDDRTYPDELARLRAENERLESELTLRLRQLMQTSTDYGQLLTANEELRNELSAMEAHWRNAESEATTAKADAAELSKALDMCIAERDSAFAEADAHRRELTALRDERPRLLAANVRLFHDNNALRAELGQCISENNQLTENAAELGQALDLALAERDGAFAEVDALRAELDAMRQAHSATAARMEAMGC